MKVRVIESAEIPDGGLAAIYIRVTKEESVATDLSIPNQRARSLEICAEREWSPAKLYIEPKHVGGDLGPSKRPALAELLRDIEAGKVTRVLVRHTDRLWRGSRVQDLVLDALLRKGVELWDFGGLREQRSAGGRFALKVMGAAAELEKNLTGERIREMKRGKAKAGKVGGGPPPYGYTSQSRVLREARASGMSAEEAEQAAVKRCPLGRALYVDEHEAQIVRLMFNLYLENGWGARRIAIELNRLGHRRRAGLLWVASKTRGVINNPVVAGFTSYDEAAYAKGMPSKSPRYRQTLYQGVHTAIIPANTWREAQRIKNEINLTLVRTMGSSSARNYLLTGVISCGNCGAPMRGRSRNARLATGSYICSRRAYHGKELCPWPSIPQHWVESTVWSYLERLLRSPEIIAAVVSGANQKMKRTAPKAKQRIEEIRAEVASLQMKQRKWMDRLEDRDDSASELLWGRIKELETRRVALEQERDALEAQLPRVEDRRISPEDVQRALAKLREIGSGSPEKQRQLINRLVLHHDLRVRMLDRLRLAVSLRLDPIDDASGRKAVGTRLVVAGGPPRGLAGGQGASVRPMGPGSPVPGGPESKRLCPPATATSIAARARCWPRTSDMSTGATRRCAGSAGARGLTGWLLRSALIRSLR